jgi:CRISPR/Cas system endoribonuclease Cas6 (RAMP superfamily)
MRFKLALLAHQKPALLPFNYQYPLSSAIYKIIQKLYSHPLQQRLITIKGGTAEETKIRVIRSSG